MDHLKLYPFDLAAKNVASQIFVESLKQYKILDQMAEAAGHRDEEGQGEILDVVDQIAMRSCVLAMALNKSINNFDETIKRRAKDLEDS